MTEHECEHKNIAINPALTTSVMAITLNIFGFKCEDCGKQWDIGNAVEAIQATERLSAKRALLIANAIDKLGYTIDGMDGGNSTRYLRDYADILEGKDET